MSFFPIWIFLAVCLYGLFHSLLASLAAKALAHHLFSPRADRWYRLGFNVISTLSLLPVLALPVLLPDRIIYRIPSPWVLFSTALQLFALLFLAVGLLQTGVWDFMGLRQLFGEAHTQPPRLIVNGLYRWIRHPLYTAGLVLIWLVPVLTANLLALNAGLTLYLFVGAWFEERKLLHKFGAAYADYQKRTPMWIPLPSKRY